MGWNREKLYTMEEDGPSTMTYRCSERERREGRKTHRYKLWMDSEKEHGEGASREKRFLLSSPISDQN